MAGQADWVPPGVDTRRANAARVYDYLLGGSHNFLADQDVGRAIAAVEPNARAIGRANRAFLGRAVQLPCRARYPAVPRHRLGHPHRAQRARGRPVRRT